MSSFGVDHAIAVMNRILHEQSEENCSSSCRPPRSGHQYIGWSHERDVIHRLPTCSKHKLRQTLNVITVEVEKFDVTYLQREEKNRN